MNNSVARGKRTLTITGIVVLAASLSACQDDPTASPAVNAPLTATASGAPAARVSVSVADGATNVRPATVVSVRAVEGSLRSVSVAGLDGTLKVAGRLSTSGVWSTNGILMPGTTYRVSATARNADGTETRHTSSFSTVTPQETIRYTVTPDGWTVGAGMPVQVKFDAPVSSATVKADIERRLSTKITPAQAGSWGWTSDRVLLFRPKTYWKAGTTIEVKAPLAGTEISPGSYLMEDNGAKLTIGTQRVMRVDLAKHTMTLTENGAPVRTFLISGGRPGERFETRAGTKVVLDKHADIVMDSSTFGIDKTDPEYYRTKVKWAVRITDSGEFLHSAPWSVAQQGRANVSHGCINMAPGEAEWLFNRVIPGDVVENVNSDYRLQPGEAGIPVWLWSWQQWQAKSALAGKPANAPTA